MFITELIGVNNESCDKSLLMMITLHPCSSYTVLPPAPSDATVQRTSATSYQLTWTNSPENVDGYVISYATTPGGFPTNIDLPPGRTNPEQILNLPENTDFTFNLYSQRNGLRTQATLTTLPPVTQGNYKLKEVTFY